MTARSPGLLQRLQQTGEQAAWGRLVDLFSPHLFLWVCRAGLPGPEAVDLVRAVLDVVAETLPEFRRGAPGGFRGWLRGLAHAQRREIFLKRKAVVGAPAVADPVPPVPCAADSLWEADYLPVLLRNACELFQGEFPPADWKACWGVLVEARPASEVARELKLSVADVYAAEARVLRKLRQELDGLLD